MSERTTLERRRLAPGLEISRVLTGLWQVADMERGGEQLDPAASAKALEPYVDAGLTTFDMADHYGSAEVIAGRLTPDREAPPELLTKWVPRPGKAERGDAATAVDRARKRLGRDRIDLLQYHAWNYWDPRYLDHLWELSELQTEGTLGALGVTNTDTAHLRMMLETGFDISSNQVAFSLLDSRPRDAMTELCDSRGLHLLAYGTLAGGFLTDRWLGREEPAELTTWSQMKYRRFIAAAGGWPALQRVLATAAQVAARHGVSIANVAARWVLQQPAVGGVIIGARPGRSEHIDETLRLFTFELDSEDLERLDEVLATLSPIPGDCGDEYRRPPFLTASGDLSHHVDAMPTAWEAQAGAGGRRTVSSGTEWEAIGGYSRAVRIGERILVSGTTATHGDRLVGGADPASQTHFAIDKIEGALRALGGTLDDVVRTRVFVRDAALTEAVARVHGVRFARARPANTVVEARLVGDRYLVEVEAEAVVA